MTELINDPECSSVAEDNQLASSPTQFDPQPVEQHEHGCGSLQVGLPAPAFRDSAGEPISLQPDPRRVETSCLLSGK